MPLVPGGHARPRWPHDLNENDGRTDGVAVFAWLRLSPRICPCRAVDNSTYCDYDLEFVIHVHGLRFSHSRGIAFMKVWRGWQVIWAPEPAPPVLQPAGLSPPLPAAGIGGPASYWGRVTNCP